MCVRCEPAPVAVEASPLPPSRGARAWFVSAESNKNKLGPSTDGIKLETTFLLARTRPRKPRLPDATEPACCRPRHALAGACGLGPVGTGGPLQRAEQPWRSARPGRPRAQNLKKRISVPWPMRVAPAPCSAGCFIHYCNLL